MVFMFFICKFMFLTSMSKTEPLKIAGAGLFISAIC